MVGPAKVLLVSCVFLPPALGLVLRAQVLIDDPRQEPYIDPEVLRALGDMLTGWVEIE